MSVVYVDDEPALCRTIGILLRALGVDVYTFTDPHQALAHIRDKPPRVILCDYRMPEMDGLALFAELDPTVPFLLISGDLSLNDERTRDVTQVIQKPVRPERLLQIIKTYLDS